MANHDRLRLVWHGAIVLLTGLLCGLPTVAESLVGDSGRVWHTAHEALMMMGIWMLASSSVIPVLVLQRNEASLLFWSLVIMGYGFVVALTIGGAVGVSPFSPGGTPVSMTAFLAAVIGILGSVLSTALTLMGAHNALSAGARSDTAGGQ
jgi:hypothetical protein